MVTSINSMERVDGYALYMKLKNNNQTTEIIPEPNNTIAECKAMLENLDKKCQKTEDRLQALEQKLTSYTKPIIPEKPDWPHQHPYYFGIISVCSACALIYLPVLYKKLHQVG